MVSPAQDLDQSQQEVLEKMRKGWKHSYTFCLQGRWQKLLEWSVFLAWSVSEWSEDTGIVSLENCFFFSLCFKKLASDKIEMHSGSLGFTGLQANSYSS